MEEISQIVRSYFNYRTAVIRLILADKMSKSSFSRITGLDENSKYRRLSKPELWKPVEIHWLAVELELDEPNTSRLKSLASLINDLPDLEKRVIFKDCALTTQKLNERMDNPDSWLAKELEKLKLVMNRY